MKILHLVLYSDNTDYYKKMYKLTSEYYKIFSDRIDTYYYKFDNSITEEFLLVDNILNIKGSESYIPGILNKTIKAFKYFAPKIDEYDYILRSNISSVINFTKLFEFLETNEINIGMYFCYYGKKNKINNSYYQIFDDNLKNILYRYIYCAGKNM